MGRGLSVSLDLDGTLTDLAFVDGVWNEGLPKLVAEHRGIDYAHARELCRDAYLQEGEASIRWYQLSYWLDRFDLQHVDEDAVITGFTSRISLFADVIPALTTLRQEGCRLVLFSNAPRPFLDQEVCHTSLDDYLDEMISLPDDWGMVKSGEEAYLRLLASLDGEVVHAGDHLSFDVEVPRRAGITAYHIWRGTGAKLDDSLTDLGQLVDRITRGQNHP
ncbi:MAG: HAD family hydrolase [Syntrophaceae bacterium]